MISRVRNKKITMEKVPLKWGKRKFQEGDTTVHQGWRRTVTHSALGLASRKPVVVEVRERIRVPSKCGL